jgi:hypothetical protein
MSDAPPPQGGTDLHLAVDPALDDDPWPCAVCGTPTILHCARCHAAVCADHDCPEGCDA